jgi:hypothetical protein
MKISGDAPLALSCKFKGRQVYALWNYQIKIDNTSIVEPKAGKDYSCPAVPFRATYPIPLELTKNKTFINVMFEVKNSSHLPQLMEMRIIKR